MKTLTAPGTTTRGLLILAAIHLSSAASVDVPALDQDGGDLIVNKSQVFSLACIGNKPLHWSYPTYSTLSKEYASIQKRFKIEDLSLPISNEYQSVLTINTTQYMDTGKYRCSYNSNPTDSNSASVYIFVPDKDDLLVKEKNDNGFLLFVSLMGGRPGIIPCRTSDPNALVRLTKDSDSNFNSSVLKYDPKQGFFLDFVTRTYAGSYLCHAGSKRLRILVRYQSSSTTALYPKAQRLSGSSVGPRWLPITKGMKSEILASTNVTFNCFASSMVDPIGSQIKWQYPSTVDQSQIVLGQPMVKHNTNRYDINQQLTIVNLGPEDSGMFMCLAGKTGSFNTISFELKVYGKPFVEIDLVEHNEATEGEIFTRLEVKVQSFPNQFNIIWKKSNKILVDARYKTSNNFETGVASLTINSPKWKDRGNYEITASVANVMVTKTLSLTVRVKPKIEEVKNSSPNYPYYIIGKKYELKCKVSGFPLPEIIWQVFPCYRQKCQQGWAIVNNSINSATYSQSENMGYLNLIAEQSAIYRCVGNNLLGFARAEQNQDFVVTDLMDKSNKHPVAYRVDRPPSQPVEGDPNFEIMCSVNKLIYSSVSVQKLTDKGPITFPTADPRITVVKMNRSMFSHHVTLTVSNVNFNDSGQYVCVLTRAEGNFIRLDVTIDVRDVIPPVFLYNPPSEVIRIKHRDRHQFNCSVGGLPQPVVTWYKDGKIYNKMESGIKFSKDNNLLTIERVSLKDEGHYKCRAENRGGLLETNFTIQIYGKIILPTSKPVQSDELSTKDIGMISGIVGGVFILAIIIIICLVKMKRKDHYGNLDDLLKAGIGEINPDIPIDEQTEQMPYDPKWEFPIERLKLGMVLGQGAFGRVVKAQAIGLNDYETSTTVAVKMVKDGSDAEQIRALISELKILNHVGQHLNINNLVGAVTKNLSKGELYVMVEYCGHGNLRQYLMKNRVNFRDTMDDIKSPTKREMFDNDYAGNIEGATNLNYINVKVEDDEMGLIHIEPEIDSFMKPHMRDSTSNGNSSNSGLYRKRAAHSGYLTDEQIAKQREDFLNLDNPLITKDLVCFAFQIIRGLEYLASKKYIHRDLAARNILVADDKVVKICDFGLAKDIYKYTNNEYKKKTDGPLPIKWMALESLTHKLFTTKSDIWSYGVLIWELFSLGGTPYPSLEINETFVERLSCGYRMEQPRYASKEIYQLMLHCWHPEPDERPSAAELADQLGDLLHDNVKDYYMDLNSQFEDKKKIGTPGYMSMNSNGYLTMQDEDQEDEDEDEDEDEGQPTIAAGESQDQDTGFNSLGEGPVSMKTLIDKEQQEEAGQYEDEYLRPISMEGRKSAKYDKLVVDVEKENKRPTAPTRKQNEYIINPGSANTSPSNEELPQSTRLANNKLVIETNIDSSDDSENESMPFLPAPTAPVPPRDQRPPLPEGYVPLTKLHTGQGGSLQSNASSGFHSGSECSPKGSVPIPEETDI